MRLSKLGLNAVTLVEIDGVGADSSADFFGGDFVEVLAENQPDNCAP